MLSLDPLLKRTLRDNKNTRLHVLIVLLSQVGPVPQASPANEIADELNFNRDTVNDALRQMARDGYAARTAAGWIATAKARQLPLANLLLCTGMEAHQSGLLPAASDSEIMVGRKFSAPFVVVVDQDQLDQASSDQQQQTEASEAEIFRLGDRDEVRAALDVAGVKAGKHRRTLLADEWVTVERIDKWQTEIERMAGEDQVEFTNPVGYLMQRLLEHDAPPAPSKRKYYRGWTVPTFDNEGDEELPGGPHGKDA